MVSILDRVLMVYLLLALLRRYSRILNILRLLYGELYHHRRKRSCLRLRN